MSKQKNQSAHTRHAARRIGRVNRARNRRELEPHMLESANAETMVVAALNRHTFSV